MGKEVKMPEEFERRFILTHAEGTQRLVLVYDTVTQEYVSRPGWPKHLKGHAYRLNRKFYMKFGRHDVEELFKTVGTKAAVALLENRAVLNIYRNSSPHNWWVSKSKGDNGDYIWHSSDDRSVRITPTLDIFTNVHNEGRVSYGRHWIFGSSDEGMSVESAYVVNDKVAAVWKRMSDTMRAEFKRKHKNV